MEIKHAEFICSSAKVSQCPKPDRPEYAFIGRSNVGKSSLINMLTMRQKLAKISGKPGKTRLINHFLINQSWYLVDLPGYGYAKISKSQRLVFQKLIDSYIMQRPNLLYLFVLLDVRHAPQSSDLQFMEQLGLAAIPFAMVFTKADKLSKNKIEENLRHYRQKMLESWEELPPVFLTSASKNQGKAELLNFIAQSNATFAVK